VSKTKDNAASTAKNNRREEQLNSPVKAEQEYEEIDSATDTSTQENRPWLHTPCIVPSPSHGEVWWLHRTTWRLKPG